MLILASQSPRRAELLTQVGVTFSAQPADIDEIPLAGEDAASYVRRIAVAKAAAVRQLFPNDPVLGSDTAVVLDQRILGKPVDRDDAIAMLMDLSGRAHQVMTGVAVIADKTYYQLNTSEVSFRRLSEQEAAAYWQTGEPIDKAGAYAVQGLGAAFVQRIAGSYSGIMGLPLFETLQILRTIGVHSRVDSAHE